MRPGAFDGANDSDGYHLRDLVTSENGDITTEFSEMINPRDNPRQRGWLERTIAIPPQDSASTLRLEFGAGSANSNAWDWPLLGEPHIER